jgi:hypothetical protein
MASLSPTVMRGIKTPFLVGDEVLTSSIALAWGGKPSSLTPTLCALKNGPHTIVAIKRRHSFLIKEGLG